MASTAYNYVDIHDGVPSGAAGVILNDNFSAISDITLDSIQGLHTSNGTDSNHDIDITVGAATDSTNADVLVLGSAITKRIDAAWAVGTGNGGIDTGSVSSSTWYAVWLIKRSDTGVVDALFSTSFSSPTMPTNYDFKRLMWAVKTNGSANILGYRQIGDRCWWDDLVVDLSDTTPVTSYTNLTVAAPPYSGSEWCGQGFIEGSSGTDQVMYLTTPDTDRAYYQIISAVSAQYATAAVTIPVNSSGQLRYRSNTSTVTNFFILTIGFYFFRGRAVE